MDKQQTKRARKKGRNGAGGEKSIKFRCDYSSTPLKVLESRGWTRIYDPKDRGWDLWWCDASEIKLALDWGQGWERLRAQQRVAHFLNHGELTRKNLLYRNLRRYKRLLLKAGKPREAALCDIMPVSFELPSEYRMLVEEYRRCQGATWIVKPAAGSQGRGIFLFQRLRDLQEWRAKEYPEPSPDDSDHAAAEGPGLPAPPDVYVVQKYIDDPYLLGGCKFDMRIYVLVTCFQPLKVWLAREGFARLSGEQFSLERINDSRVHLTNMSIQLKASAGSNPQPDPSPQPNPTSTSPSPPVKLGSKWPLSCLRQYLTERHGAAVIDDLLHNIAGMADVVVCFNNQKTHISINDNGNLSASSLKFHFPSADGLTYADEEGKIQSVVIASDEFQLNPSVKEYNVYCSHKASDIETASASNEAPENCNKENESNAVNNEKCTGDNTKNELEGIPDEKPAKVKNVEKSLRVGWLNKAAGATKYRRVKKPRGGVIKLKLDAGLFYSAHQIKRMAIEAYVASCVENCAIEEEFAVSLGDFGGREIAEFRRSSDGRLCDIWEYCQDRGQRLYQLNLFMLTSPIDEEKPHGCEERPRTISTRGKRARQTSMVENEVRVLYLYVRRSSYSQQLSYIEYEKPQLHERVLDDQYGDGPPLELFEPANYGYAICRIERAGRLLLQRCFGEEDGAAAGRAIEFPARQAEGGLLDEHGVLHDLDEVQGHCNGKFGIGFVPSCDAAACRPLFSWYRDGVLFKQLEGLYWLDDVKDAQPHRWSCTVSCRSTNRQLESKEILVNGLLD